MIHLTRKKKNYIRPEAEATWMDNDDLMGITGSVPDVPWGNAKGNKISLLDPEDGDRPDPNDDGWGMYFGYDFDE